VVVSRLDKQLIYWKKQLPGESDPLLEPILDFPRPPVQSFIRSAEYTCVEAASTIAFSEQENRSPFVVLTAALNVLLARYTAQTDLVTGTIFSDSHAPDGSTFVNPVPLRVSVSEDLSVSQFLDSVSEAITQTRANRDVPFSRLIAETGGDTPDYAPLFQVMLSLRNTPAVSEFGASAEKLRVASEYTVRCDLAFEVEIDNENMRIGCDYDALLFESATVRRMLGHFGIILEALAADKRIPVGALPMLTAAERERVLVEWNNTTVDFPRDAGVHHLFEAQAAEIPDGIALLFQDEEISYQALNNRANQLAHYLIKAGVRPGDPVTVFIERSVEMFVGILGVLKAGGVYVPMDTNYPTERVRLMLQDSLSRTILSQHHLMARLPEGHANVICIDQDWPRIAGEVMTDPAVQRRGGDIAYVMFTSGSTGQPKGIQVRHRSIVRLVKGANYAALTPDQTFLQLAPVSFDASTLEIWGALLNGAKVVIMPPAPPTLGELARAITKNKVSVLWLTAGLFHQMVDTHPEALLTVSQLLAGGDVLQIDHVRRLLAMLPDGHRLVNGYGPTENTTFTCCHVMNAGQQIEKTVPIGSPISNTKVYVLNKYLCPVPVGIPGELFVGGAGLAWGYLNQPRLTAQRFIPDPFSETPGERLYKTGDLVQWREDGSIEFLGRLDNQVKIRGYRVEPGEIEEVLIRHPRIAKALVRPFQHDNGQQFLAAYLVLHKGFAADPDILAELGEYARQYLPDYMLPAVYEFVPDFPLTPNGKVDRDSLPLPRLRSLATKPMYTPPRTPAEEVLADLWQELLAVELMEIGIHDNFFALGGHSLLATQLMARIQKIFRTEPSLTVFFGEPTIAGLIESLYRHEPKPGQIETAARLYLQIQRMSPEEVQEMLRRKQSQG
jgi:amino acid adenylation domain-containing protein